VYLEEKVFPILTSGLEELLAQVESRETDPSGHALPDFNPLFFLARYLMKNNPQKGQEQSIECK